MVRLGRVGQVDDQRVVEHGAVALVHHLNFAHQSGDQLEVEAADQRAQFVGAAAAVAAPVADAVLADVDPEPAEADAEVLGADAAARVTTLVRPAMSDCRSQVEVGVEPVGLDLAAELVGYRRGRGGAGSPPARQPAVPLPHRLERLRRCCAAARAPGQPGGLPAPDVLGHIIEEVALAVEGAAGAAAGDAAEQGRAGQVRAGTASAGRGCGRRQSSCK